MLEDVSSLQILTADSWTSRAMASHLGVSCHSIAEDWQRKTVSLATMPHGGRRRCTNSTSCPKIKGLVHNNGSNIVAAMLGLLSAVLGTHYSS